MGVSAAELFDRHHAAVYRYALRMTGRRDVAEDITQDVFLRVVRGQERYRDEDRERAWIFRIARNLLADRRRHDRRAPAAAPAADTACGPHQERGLAVRLALASLPEVDRDVFLLRVVGGLGHDEIAALTGLTEPAVRSRIFRARTALRALLSDNLRGRAPGRRLKVVP